MGLRSPSQNVSLDFGITGGPSLREQLEGVQSPLSAPGGGSQEKEISSGKVTTCRNRDKVIFFFVKNVELIGRGWMKTIVLIGLNPFLLGLFLFLLTRKELLTFRQDRRWWLTWLAIGIITLMDEFTSIFYVPAEAYRFIGPGALVFIAITSLLIRFMSTRFTEIGEILEHNNIIGGGVYSISYLVLGPVISFVAIASIMVDYTITACISAVSAVSNAISFTPYAQSPSIPLLVSLGVLWFVAGLNIAGIKANVRFTFGVFILAAFVILNLIVSGVLDFGKLGSPARLQAAVSGVFGEMHRGSWLDHYGTFVSHIAFCILAYSGIESVIQTAGLVKNWHDIRKAYWFLALTVGLTTPLVALLALTAPIDFGRHEMDLIPHFATISTAGFRDPGGRPGRFHPDDGGQYRVCSFQ